MQRYWNEELRKKQHKLLLKEKRMQRSEIANSETKKNNASLKENHE